jgi:hypothetical protein
MGTSQTLDQARAAAAAGVAEAARAYTNAVVPLADQVTASMLIGQFMTAVPQNLVAAASLIPLFDFVLAVQKEAQPFVAAARAALTPDGAYAAADPYKPTIHAPKLDAWGTKYP